VSKLDSWIADDAGREKQKSLSDTEFVVSAPVDHVVNPFLSREEVLADRAYIKSVDYNLLYTTQEVEDLLESSQVSLSRAARIGQQVYYSGSFEAGDLAYSDNSEPGTLAESVSQLKQGSTEDGSGITIAILDSGCNTATDGSLFGERITGAKDLTTGDTGLDAVKDSNGHGTWCAVAAAGSEGVAPGANLLVGKVMADDGSGSTADIVDGVRWAVDNGADAISMSLGSPVYSEALAEALSDAVDDGVVPVVATGNSRQTIRWVASPADTDTEGVVRVGATDVPDEDTEDAQSAYFSQVGPDGALDGSMGSTRGVIPTVAAPGMLITATVADASGDLFESELSGTSMATPQAAGGIACAMSGDSLLVGNPSTVVDRIAIQSTPLPRCGHTEVGAGMLNVDLLASDSNSESTQEDSVDDGAASRDTANKSLSGSVIDEVFGIAE
jgi:subtilisin family serine protease